MNVYEQYRKMGESRAFFDEYVNLARLVDDLDIRFWKRYMTRDSRRHRSIDEALAEKEIRREYQSCVEDLIAMQADVRKALSSVKTDLCRDLLTDSVLRDMDLEEIGDKWNMEIGTAGRLIRQGLLEATVPEAYLKSKGKYARPVAHGNK